MSSTNFFLFAIVSIEMTFGWQCHFETTPYNSDGGGNMVYLDRHYLNCGKRGMVRFHLDRNGGSIRYEYFCCDIPAETPGKSISYTTAFTADGNGDTVYLDRETVDCGPSAILTAIPSGKKTRTTTLYTTFFLASNSRKLDRSHVTILPRHTSSMEMVT